MVLGFYPHAPPPSFLPTASLWTYMNCKFVRQMTDYQTGNTRSRGTFTRRMPEPSDDRRKNICRLFARFGYKQISTRINFWYLMKRDSSFDSKESTWDMEISLADNYGPPLILFWIDCWMQHLPVKSWVKKKSLIY